MREVNHTLSANSLSLSESIVMGTAGGAPAFSISAAMVTVFALVGPLAPASIFYCGLIMFGITLAFIHLNRISVANSGAAYAWVTKIFGAYLGFFVGWALLVSSALFMVSASIPAATAVLLLFAPDLQHESGLVALIAILWLSFISVITIQGIKPSSYLQILMTGIEMIVLVAIIGIAIYYYANHPVHDFSFSWLSLSKFTPDLFAKGALGAIFLYWGWDVTLNLNEETKNAKHAPGWAAFWSILIIMAVFVGFACISQLMLSETELQQSGTNIIFVVADKLFSRPWGYVAILSVMFSSAGTIQTTMLQFSRTMFAVSRDGMFHQRYAKVHASWKTPWLSIVFIWVFGVLLLGLSANFLTVEIIIKDSINAIGFQVAFYYSVTGFACAWYYRRAWKNFFGLFGFILWPMLSAIFLIFIACLCIPTFDMITNVIGIGGICLGIIPLLLNKLYPPTIN